ncbi:rod shape-determining protein MreD [Leptospira kanakyensis]|uniref:Rod shape-determining protein MreD n=1 Tax=Leptospira kanakyensis TaxID=2484968 RepID=A0A6N4Q3M2_9LEPT|nr:rod shape-determining protein MreD [Leptospira kanakyensis]MCW7468732.1 rod shape-determining protein MreD [Leptospira kanakyensis]MCW7479725.1 rod shape-determining protein MreD [Leptospira kanakyensis]TGK49962.1 rod shape-determining protein MreD [Leptospira kanakyensis]TGK58521.1 rod shape-determining protein MreD [Leptospira kanakyensis]TGK69100.1 rod shape-determining protein MreD [Leptospira kanakyensis]
MILDKLFIIIGLLLSHFLNGSNVFELGNAIRPDFMVIFVVFFALRKGPLYGLWLGFFGGLLTDTALGGEIGGDNIVYYKIGLHSFSYAIIGYIVGKVMRSSYTENYISITIYILGFTLVSRIITYLLFLMFFHSNQSYSFLYVSLYNAFIGPALFFLFSWAFRLDADEVRQ